MKGSSFRIKDLLILTFLLVAGLAAQSKAQIIIKGKLELADTTNISKSQLRQAKVQSQELEYRDAWYNQFGGSYSLSIDEWAYEEYQLWEEGLGLLEAEPYEGQTIQLGEFDQWTRFKFYRYHPESGYKKFLYPFNKDYYMLINLWPAEKDSALAQIPPAEALEYHGNPFIPSGEVTIREDGFMRLDIRGGSIGQKDLYIDMPKDSLIKENITEVYIEHIDIGIVRAGEIYRFYIKSENPIVADWKLYPEKQNGSRIGIAELRFEDWTDLRFDDLTVFVEVVEHPRKPIGVSVREDPYKAMPDTKVFFDLKRINKNYSVEDFPEDQRYDIQMDSSKAKYAILHDPATGQSGISLNNVSENFYMYIKPYKEIEGFTGEIEIEVITKAMEPISEKFIEIDGTGRVEVIDKKLVLEFDPNPVAKGDTTTIQPVVIYANGIRKQLPTNYPLYVAAISGGEKFGTLLNTATGEKDDVLFDLSKGAQFIARSNISQDSAVVRIGAGTY
ncbi:MAG TPA: hypothetical protein VFG39_08775, partial [Balneolaceae bacterium]|nr:hypothetical protein [Balneolaceae bacterium]